MKYAKTDDICHFRQHSIFQSEIPLLNLTDQKFFAAWAQGKSHKECFYKSEQRINEQS